MKKKYKIKAFTLIEILVSLTILSIIMVSVMMIFINSTNISAKSEINRVMQENIKNIVETISEDVRKSGMDGISNVIMGSCSEILDGNKFRKGDKLCTKSGNEYYLAKHNGTNFGRVETSECVGIKNHCVIVKNGDPLSNSHISIKDLKFYYSNNDIPKVTINMTLQPAAKKGVKSNMIEENIMYFQTTISTRSFKN